MKKPSFNFPVSLLLKEGEFILDTADTFAAALNPRLPADYIETTRGVLETIQGQTAIQKSKTAEIGSLTREQKARLETVRALLRKVRRSAQLAFKRETVKLHEEFQVGIHSPANLSSIIHRSRVVLAATQLPANATSLAARGWQATDTTALNNAITALDTVDNAQESAKGEKKGRTSDRNVSASELYERLLTVQNAANLHWDENNPDNVAVRAQFRLGIFPPRVASIVKLPEQAKPAEAPKALAA